MQEYIPSQVPSKHGRGGQSAQRFERLIEEAAHSFFKKVSERASNYWLRNLENLKGIIVGGPGATKDSVVKGGFFHHEIQQRILPTLFDVGYSKPLENAVRNSLACPNTLVNSSQTASMATGRGFDFLNNMTVSTRVVLDYRRKGLRMDSGGDLSVLPMLIPTQQPDGRKLQGAPVQQVMMSGGEPMSDVKTF